jgi:hypothetical protein
LKEASTCRLEEAAYVSLYEDVDPLLLEGTPQCVKTLVGATLGTVAVATVVKQRLKQWFEHPLGGELHDLIFEAADAQRSSLLTARLGNVYPTLGVRAVSHPFEASGQILEICLQICCIHRLGHLINAHGFVALEKPITCP